MEKNNTILVVDDEPDIRELIAYHLDRAGFNSIKVKDGEAALNTLWDEDIDLMILDLMLPGINGLEVLKTIREDKRTENMPVILLTAKTTEIDKIIGFELGTDDYVSKPFSVKELLARVKALLKRSGCLPENKVYKIKDFYINFKNHKIEVKGKRITLSPKEFAIVNYLFKRKDTVISRDQILQKVWGLDSNVDSRTVDVNITRIRDKLGQCKNLIKTVKGYGYILETEEN